MKGVLQLEKFLSEPVGITIQVLHVRILFATSNISPRRQMNLRNKATKKQKQKKKKKKKKHEKKAY